MEDIMTMNDIGADNISTSDYSTSETNTSSNTTTRSNLPLTPPNTDPKKKSAPPQLAQSISSTNQPAHSRSTSATAASSPRTGKRLSLSFPVIPPGYTPPSRQTSPISGTSTPPDFSRDTPENSVTFFTALAAQERRVLELREELGKAEYELKKLKETWTLHEATKKRRELTLNTGASRTEDSLRDALTSPTRREEFQRLQNATRGANANRRVLPSQRHQRTLSLLSPDRGRQAPSFPQPDDVNSAPANSNSEKTPPLAKRHTLMNPVVSKNLEASTQSTARPHSLDLLDFPHRKNNQDAIIQTGKQIADDFKEGLWNFIEDLKQATVGDEVPRPNVPGPTSAPSGPSRQNVVRRVSSKASLRNNAAIAKASSVAMQKNLSKASLKGKEPQKLEESLIDFGQDDDNEQDGLASQVSSQDEKEASYRWSTSTTLSEVADSGIMTPPSRVSTPRTSTSSTTSQRPSDLKPTESIRSVSKPVEKMFSNQRSSEQSPIWGTLASSAAFISPGQFKKHANALMSQVEKSFALPPPGAEPDFEPPEPSLPQLTRTNSTGCSYVAADARSELRSRSGSPTKLDNQS
ncbi:hypothetical protein EDC01DRAFT_667369 [Geopyxis carbonaria]|nr:hypothetical protein EDC01DRAFT_667369 [Geopyxis carbonaria]